SLTRAARRSTLFPYTTLFRSDVAVQVGMVGGLQDVLEHAQLALLLGLERLGIVEHLAIAVAEDVGAVPARDAEHPRLEHRREHGDRKSTRLNSSHVKISYAVF